MPNGLEQVGCIMLYNSNTEQPTLKCDLYHPLACLLIVAEELDGNPNSGHVLTAEILNEHDGVEVRFVLKVR